LARHQYHPSVHFVEERMVMIKIASLLIGVPALITLYGWAVESNTLVWLFPYQISMKANTAVAFLVASIALHLLLIQSMTAVVLQRCMAIAIFAIGGLTLLQYIFDMHFPYVDHIFIQSKLINLNSSTSDLFSNRMSPLAAINLMAVALSMLFLSHHTHNHQLNLGRIFALVVLISSILVLIGYAYGVMDLYRFGFFVPLSPLSALCFLLLAISLLLIRAERGFMRLFVGQTMGSQMIRWLLPTLILVFISIGWLCRQGNLLNLYNDQFEISILIFNTLLLSCALMIWQARIQHGQELLRQRAQHALLLNNQQLEKKVQQRTEELHQLMQKLETLSLTDSLTGLANRRAYEQRIAFELEQKQRYQRSPAIVMIDVDYFKKFNDDFGHQTGDVVLTEVAQLLKNNARTTDLVCRYGGEEFIVILPDTSLNDGLAIAERFRHAIAVHAWSPRVVTISAGVASLQGNDSLQQLLNNADAALYSAKAAGRNRVMSEKLTA
jgi:diguanylate cyclase (GGDEF)-like protein